MEEVRKRGNKIKKVTMNINYGTLILKKNEIHEELEQTKYNDLENLFYRMQLTFVEVRDILDLKYVSTKRIGYSLKPNIYQISDMNNTLKNILPNNVEINVSIDEKIYKSFKN